jgi:hypothetical protein
MKTLSTLNLLAKLLLLKQGGGLARVYISQN